MEQDLSREFLKVVEEGAIAAAKTMGIGDRKFSDIELNLDVLSRCFLTVSPTLISS